MKWLFLLLILPLCSRATNYYISPGGNDSNPGTISQPWKTLEKLNNISLNPGDSALFQRNGSYLTTNGIYWARSGTSTNHIVIGSYGTGALPLFLYDLTVPKSANNRTILYFDTCKYVDVVKVKLTDITIDSTNHSINSNVGYGIGMSATASYINFLHGEISLLGIGVEPNRNCSVLYDNIHNMRMVVNTPTPTNDDFGANGVVIGGSDNTIEYCHFTGLWATSYDYGYDGGAIEVYGNTVNGNTIMYNTCINNNGFMEAGSAGTGVMSNNVIAYNLLINQGGTLMLHTAAGSFHIGVSNLQLYNNDIIETVVQYAPSPYMINCTSFTPPSNPVVVMKNNIFWMTTSIGVLQPGGFLASTPASFTHTNNLYHIAGTIGFTLGATENSIGATPATFSNTAPTDPATWNYTLITGSPAVKFGVSVGITTDFGGYAVQNPPDAGIYQYQPIFCGSYTPSAPISLTGVNGQTITGLTITPVAGQALIRLTNCTNITIYNNILDGGCLPQQDVNLMGIVLVNCSNITIRNNLITKVARGVYATAYTGATANIKVDTNFFQNMTGPYPAGEAVQFNGVTGSGISISYNNIENLAGQSYPTDNINIYESSGTSASPGIIQHNQIRCTGATSGFASGSGIIVGDGNSGSYWQVISNIVVNPSHCQFAIAGGSYNYLINNTGLTNDATVINPVGIQANAAAQPCSNVFVTGNQISCFNNPFYIPTTPAPQCSPITNTLNNWHASLTPSILPAVLVPQCVTPAPNISFNPDTFIYHINQPISPATPVNVGGNATSFSISPLQPSGLNFSTTSGTLSGTPISLLAQTVFTVSAVNATGQSSCHLVLTIVNIPPNIKYSPSSQIGTINVPIIPMPVINSAGAATSFTCSPSLPPGLILTSSGTVQGTPTVTIPSTNFVITAFNSGGNSSATINLTINPPAPARPSISFSPSSYSFPVNSAITVIRPVNTGGAPSNPWSISPSLVSGLTFSTVDGSISGTPTSTISSTPYLVTASNVAGSSSATVNIAVTAIPPALPLFTYAPQSFNLTVNQSAILLAPNSTGGSVTSWSVLPALPSGLVLDGSTGILTGVGTTVTPQANYIITGSNITGSGHYTLTIAIVPQGGTNNIRVGGKVALFVN